MVELTRRTNIGKKKLKASSIRDKSKKSDREEID